MQSSPDVRIASLDLNLLLVLHAVLRERSVARAAQQLHVTPSAISNALARLRGLLGDPLVTRKGRGIIPTPRALELAPVLERAVQELERALDGRPFDAASSTRLMTLAMGESAQIAWLARIATLMQKEMPRARLRVVGIDSLVSLGDLSGAEVDLHIGVRGRGPGMHAEPLLAERLTLVAGSDHPALAGRLSRAKLAKLRHVAVQMVPSRSLRDSVSAAYERAGIERQVVLAVPTFTAAAAVAATTDLVASLPASFLAARGERLGLRAVKAPAPHPSVSICLCWHQRTHADPALIALRALVHRAVSGSSTDQGIADRRLLAAEGRRVRQKKFAVRDS